MSRIIKKISASFLLILMIFSVAFNVLDYGYKVYAASATDNRDGTYTITSDNYELVLTESIYNLMSEENWEYFLNKYESYYSALMRFTGNDPLVRFKVNGERTKIKIDATVEMVSNGSTTISRRKYFNKIRCQ